MPARELPAGAPAITAGPLLSISLKELEERFAGRAMGNVLTAVGPGIFSIALFAATRLYDLVIPEVGLAGALVAAIAAVLLAIGFNAREVAALERLPLLAGWPLAFATMALALYLAPRHAPFAPWRTWFEPAAGATGSSTSRRLASLTPSSGWLAGRLPSRSWPSRPRSRSAARGRRSVRGRWSSGSRGAARCSATPGSGCSAWRR